MKHRLPLSIMKFIISIGLLCMSLLLSACIDLAVNNEKNKQPIHQQQKATKGHVYTMRGGLGGIFSTGMNHLENTLQNEHQIPSSSTVWNKAYSLSQTIIKEYHQKKIQGPIILVGHSLGANEQIKVAKNLGLQQIPVDLLITVDAVAPIHVPANVKLAVNIYKPSLIPLFSGLRLTAVDPTKTTIDNLNVNTFKGIYVNHFTIDKNTHVQAIMIDHILKTLKG